MGGAYVGMLLVIALANCLILIAKHTRLMITAVATDDKNPLTNTDTTTEHENKPKLISFSQNKIFTTSYVLMHVEL